MSGVMRTARYQHRPRGRRDPLDRGVIYLTPHEGKRLFERAVRKYMGISAEEFIRRYPPGCRDVPDDGGPVMRLWFLSNLHPAYKVDN